MIATLILTPINNNVILNYLVMQNCDYVFWFNNYCCILFTKKATVDRDAGSGVLNGQ